MTMLREFGAPLSPSRILVHMRSLNRHIGEGSQEDAHEFLRYLKGTFQICKYTFVKTSCLFLVAVNHLKEFLEFEFSNK